jgi:hypothetical protein
MTTQKMLFVCLFAALCTQLGLVLGTPLRLDLSLMKSAKLHVSCVQDFVPLPQLSP